MVANPGLGRKGVLRNRKFNLVVRVERKLRKHWLRAFDRQRFHKLGFNDQMTLFFNNAKFCFAGTVSLLALH